MAEICFGDCDSATQAEKIAHMIFMDSHVRGAQNQKELFNIRDDQILDCVKQLKNYCTVDSDHPLPVMEALVFMENQSFTLV